MKTNSTSYSFMCFVFFFYFGRNCSCEGLRSLSAMPRNSTLAESPRSLQPQPQPQPQPPRQTLINKTQSPPPPPPPPPSPLPSRSSPLLLSLLYLLPSPPLSFSAVSSTNARYSRTKRRHAGNNLSS